MLPASFTTMSKDVTMTAFVSRLFLISALSFPAFSFAITIPGNVHSERYTFFLTETGGEMLRDMNNEAVSVKRSGKAEYSADAQRKAEAANISPLVYAASPLEQNFIRYDGKAVKALTCLLTTRTMPGTNKTYSWEETYCLDETGAAYIGSNGWPSRAIFEKSCEVGASGCPVYLGLNNDPPTMRNDAVPYVPYNNSNRASEQKETDPAIVNKVVADLKANGCAIINKYKKSPPQCGSVIEVVTGKGMDREGIRSYEIDYAEAGTGWRVQSPVTLTYRGTTLIRFKDGDSFDAVDIENPVNNQPSITSTQNSDWKMVRNGSSRIFSTKNESGTQLELACGENGNFAVRYGTEGNWTSSGPMSQLTLKVGSDEFSPDQTFFESLSNLPSSSKIVVLQMGNEYGSFSSHGLSELLKGISWKQCLNPQSSI